jgi:hypothetical protein
MTSAKSLFCQVIMPPYFKLHRRKLGVLTLVMTCVLVGLWARSLVAINRITLPTRPMRFHEISSFDGVIVWQGVFPVDESNWSKDVNEESALIFNEFASGLVEFLLTAQRTGAALDTFVLESQNQSFGYHLSEYRRNGSLGTVHVTIRKFSYWLLITPLTFLSAWLLLSMPRAKPTSIPARNDGV